MTDAQGFLMDRNYKSDYGMNNHDDKQSYGKDSNNNYYKSKDSSNVKCNNINTNVNGFNGNDIGTDSTSDLGALATEAQAADEVEVGANSFGGDGDTSHLV